MTHLTTPHGRDAEAHSDEASEDEPSRVPRRAARGVLLLGLRTVVVQLVGLAGTVVLARALEPVDFGTFAVLQFVLTFFQMFGDAGVAAALIQRREPPSQRALASVFTLHLLVGAGVVSLVWVAAPALHLVWPRLPDDSGWLLRAMSVSFLLTASRIVPMLLLERGLRFGAVAAADIVQAVVFYAVASVCAVRGLRDWTWPIALLAQSAVGAVFLWVAQPWRPHFMLDRGELRSLLRFGLPFQLKNVLGFANGALTPVVGGALLGPSAVGLANWGQQLAYGPLKAVEIVARVAFPLFSRMQADRAAQARAFERALQFCAVGVFFCSAVFLTAGTRVTVVVFSSKWLEGMIALYAFSIAILIGFIAPVVAAILDALGRPAIIARMSVGWTLLNWIVTPLAAWRWGLSGLVCGTCVFVVVGNVAVIVALRWLVPEVRLAKPLAGPALGAVLAASVGWFVLRPWADTPLRLAGGLVLALAVDLVAVALVDPAAFASGWQLVAPSNRPLRYLR